MIVYDSNQSKVSRELIEKFVSTEEFDLKSYVSDYKELKQKMDSGEAKCALVIPSDFSRRLRSGESTNIQYICDAADANLAGQGIGYSKKIVADYNNKLLIKHLNKKGIIITEMPGIKNNVRTFYSQEMDSIYFVVLLHIVVAGLIGGLVLSSTAIVREKERGTIDQLMVTPLTPFEFALAKTIAPLIIGLVATIFSFFVTVWFGVPCKGSVITFFIFMAFFLIGNIGIGVLVGSICSNMLQAILLSYVIWFPGIAITGLIMPVENMIPALQVLGNCMPTTHFMIAVNGIFQKNVGFAILWPQALELLGTGIVLFVLGTYILHRQWKQ